MASALYTTLLILEMFGKAETHTQTNLDITESMSYGLQTIFLCKHRVCFDIMKQY